MEAKRYIHRFKVECDIVWMSFIEDDFCGYLRLRIPGVCDVLQEVFKRFSRQIVQEVFKTS